MFTWLCTSNVFHFASSLIGSGRSDLAFPGCAAGGADGAPGWLSQGQKWHQTFMFRQPTSALLPCTATPGRTDRKAWMCLVFSLVAVSSETSLSPRSCLYILLIHLVIVVLWLLSLVSLVLVGLLPLLGECRVFVSMELLILLSSSRALL